ncbi:hypothetical protein PRIPAC_94375 [Pristionchus pacificus]|uniref:G protein-coupled receptor n=1 Tax=Pristionchus pacificus TaxID=54126 RepID=A0A2A6BB12_PRIPA|nr:hypothetical protein PRIPAC_94375 [Pristionchus pacificus]|eukprot:PDM63069.1 G protein-coupled receptor [Pristionchus pacificus]
MTRRRKLLPLSSSSSPSKASAVLPYSLLRLVDFKANDEVFERDLTLSATPDDGHNSTQSCLDRVSDAVGGRLLCSVRSLFESQFEPRSGLIVGASLGTGTFAAMHKDMLNYAAHPCNHGTASGRSLDDPHYTPPGPSSEVIIALQGGFLLYGCHNYIVIPHNLIQFKECKEPPEEEHPPCTLTAVVWKQNSTLIAEDYVCCCNGTGCAAVIVDQGGLISPFPLLRFNIELDEAVTSQIERMIYPHGGGKYRIGGNLTVRRLRYFKNIDFGITDIVLVCMIFFTIIGSMALLVCFQWLCQAIISVLTLILLISGCILDILDDILPDVLLFFRAYIWLFLVNSLMGAYGNLVVVLCLDRYVAMHRPLYYRNSFAKRRMRYSLILGSLIIGFLTCLHWLWVNTINEDGDIVENSSIVDDWQYNLVRTLSYLLKYLCPGVAMSTITWANILFLRKSYDDELRIARQESMDHVVSNHTNISRISIFLAVTFIVCNWPYAVIDYFYDEECEACMADESKDYCCYDDELEANTAYAIVVLIINFMQIVYIQLNLLFFSLCSSVYRRALMHILKKPVNFFLAILEKIRAFISWKAKSRKIYQEERFLSLSTDSGVSAKTVFTVC